MRILLVAATEAELAPFEHQPQDIHVDILITGVGMVATTFELTKNLSANSYDLVINAGIAGTFDRSIKIGSVVEVVSERFSELGVEDSSVFVSTFEIGLVNSNELPYSNGELVNRNSGLSGLIGKSGITVNRVHGNSQSICEVVKKFNPEIESMEGAAVFYVCLRENVQFMQIRAISNYIEERNKDAWNITLAIANLNNELKRIVSQFETQL